MGKSLFYRVFGTCLHGKRPVFHAVLISHVFVDFCFFAFLILYVFFFHSNLCLWVQNMFAIFN